MVAKVLSSLVLVAVLGLGATPEHAQCLMREQAQPPVCDKPDSWNCGNVEHACSRTGHAVEGDDTANWHVCGCWQKCTKDGKRDNSAEAWDKNCKARCKQDHCHCPPRCVDTE